MHSYALSIDLGELRRAIRREARLLEHDTMAVESACGVDVDTEATWQLEAKRCELASLRAYGQPIINRNSTCQPIINAPFPRVMSAAHHHQPPLSTCHRARLARSPSHQPPFPRVIGRASRRNVTRRSEKLTRRLPSFSFDTSMILPVSWSAIPGSSSSMPTCQMRQVLAL